MDYTILTLLVVAILLILLSLIKKDRSKQIEEQIEQLSITYLQEIYQLKKKVKILEEEILATSDGKLFHANTKVEHKVDLLTEVIEYYEAGYSEDKIAELTTLSEHEVHNLLKKYLKKE
ncbi:MAG TPA: hypothetical protein GX525_08785 [Bacilli bacterium]|nr:hypothetical protein [Bacilli bacterium]